MWCVPGCAFEDGRGWNLWLSRGGTQAFGEPAVTVALEASPDTAEPFRTSFDLHPTLAGLDRRTGVLSITLDNPRPGMRYILRLSTPAPQEFRLNSLPSQIPEEGLIVLLASCFYRNTDKDGHYLSAVRSLPTDWRPDVKFLVGDQVYTDWPMRRLMGSGSHKAVRLYANRYEEYWRDDAYRRLMGLSPNFFLCDDHEYWNDFPEKQIHLARSFGPGRDQYASAARELYKRFQSCNNPGTRAWFQLRVGAVSFFFADTRSEREFYSKDGTSRFISAQQLGDLRAWGRGLIGPGILVLGQPLFQKEGGWKDHSLSNFVDDYSRLWRVIEDALDGKGDDGRKHDILVLSGDIHTGRLLTGERGGSGGTVLVRELIGSPASMISTAGKDPSEPDYKFNVGRGANRRSWKVRKRSGDSQGSRTPFFTRDDNVVLLRFLNGTNNRVAVEMGIWRICPRDERSWWDKRVGREREEGDHRWLLTPRDNRIELA